MATTHCTRCSTLKTFWYLCFLAFHFVSMVLVGSQVQAYVIITPNDSLRATISQLPSGETLMLSPGIYTGESSCAIPIAASKNITIQARDLAGIHWEMFVAVRWYAFARFFNCMRIAQRGSFLAPCVYPLPSSHAHDVKKSIQNLVVRILR